MATKKKSTTSTPEKASKNLSKKKSKAGPSVTSFLQKLGGAPTTRGRATPAKGLLGDIQREDLIRAGRIASDDDMGELDTSRTVVHVEVSRPTGPESARQLHRADWRERVEVRGVFSADAKTSTSVNLSAGGIFVETSELLDVGDPVMLTFPVDDSHVMNVSGRVKWVSAFGTVDDARPGMGIGFVGLDEKKRIRLERLLRSLPAHEENP